MKQKLTAVAVVLAALLSSCGQSEQGQAKDVASGLSGDSKGAAADNPLCKLFSAAEASSYAGKKLTTAKNAAMGTGCQWEDPNSDEDVSVIVQAVGISYASPPSEAPGFHELPDLGAKAYVVPELGGWTAGAPQGEDFVVVLLSGPGASETTAIALLKETMKRRK